MSKTPNTSLSKSQTFAAAPNIFVPAEGNLKKDALEFSDFQHEQCNNSDMQKAKKLA